MLNNEIIATKIETELENIKRLQQNIFTHIPGNVDKKIPLGVGWHKSLVEQMQRSR